jgi:ATP-binding cassette subfamily B protein
MSGFASLKEKTSFITHYFWKYRRLMAVGITALVIVDTLDVLPAYFLKRAIDITVARGPLWDLEVIALLYLGVGLIQGICRYVWRMYLVRGSFFSSRDLRSWFAHHLFGLGMSFFDRTRIGDLMSLATSDVDAVRVSIGPGILTIADSLFYFMTVPIAMWILSPKLALLAFIPMPIIPFIVMRNESQIHERYEAVQEQFGKISAVTQESLNGIRVTKAFAKEDVQLSRFRAEGDEYVRLSMRLARVQASFGPILDFTMSMGLVILLYVGGHSLIFSVGAGAITLGTFVAFQRYIQKMVWPMAALGLAFSYMQRSITSSGRLKEIFAQSTDVPEAKLPTFPAGATPVAAGESQPNATWKTAGAIEFRNLTFAFPGTNKAVLSNIELLVAPGERIAFVGAVGTGKSALLSLLPRLYPVGAGMLKIDGVDVNDWPIEELRRQVGYVSQDVFLFSETVVDNVAYGIHHWTEKEAAIEQATQLAAVHEDVAGLVGAWRTRLGERGVNLSGGQKQRLTIARALAKNPAILVMDDALSSVDVQTEERILRGLKSRPGRNTEIIAAHRISTIRDADRIVVLQDGRIEQLGTHNELLKQRSGPYRSFYEQQRLKEDLENYVENLSFQDPAFQGEVP